MIEPLIELILFCLCTASFGHFLQMTMNDGMILYKYKLWLNKLESSENKTYRNLSAILGGCIYCNGPYLFALFWVLFYVYYCNSTWFLTLLLLPLGVAVNYIWTVFIYRYIL